MDIQHLVDRLEELIDEGRHMPFSKFTMIDEERALDLIDQMRISIPEEIEKAARVLAQRDRILAQANEEAARIVNLARERSEQMSERHEVVKEAQVRAERILEEARQEADNITADADGYVLERLQSLEQQLTKMLQVVRNGITSVSDEPAPAPVPTRVSPAPQPATPPQAPSSAVPNTSSSAPSMRVPVDVGVSSGRDEK